LEAEKMLLYATIASVTWNDTWKRRTAALRSALPFVPSIARAGMDTVRTNDSIASVPKPLTVSRVEAERDQRDLEKGLMVLEEDGCRLWECWARLR
jgi:hypothetical protein